MHSCFIHFSVGSADLGPVLEGLLSWMYAMCHHSARIGSPGGEEHSATIAWTDWLRAWAQLCLTAYLALADSALTQAVTRRLEELLMGIVTKTGMTWPMLLDQSDEAESSDGCVGITTACPPLTVGLQVRLLTSLLGRLSATMDRLITELDDSYVAQANRARLHSIMFKYDTGMGEAALICLCCCAVMTGTLRPDSAPRCRCCTPS